MRILSSLALSSAISMVLVAPVAAYAANVSDIRVAGSERRTRHCFDIPQPEKGDVVTQDALDEALKSLFATGLFADVQVSETGGVVTVRVIGESSHQPSCV